MFVCLLLFCCLSGFYARLLVARTDAVILAHARLLFLPPRAVIPPRRICFPLPLSGSTMCHCSGPGGNVDPGRGSLLQPERLCCVGLCGTFVWLPPHLPEQLNSLAVGTLPQTAAVNRTGEKAPITRAACGLRAAACGDGLVAGPLACVHLRGASQHHVR